MAGGCESVDAGFEDWLELGYDWDGAAAGGCLACADEEALGPGCECDVFEGECECFGDAKPAPAEQPDDRSLDVGTFTVEQCLVFQRSEEVVGPLFMGGGEDVPHWTTHGQAVPIQK